MVDWNKLTAIATIGIFIAISFQTYFFYIDLKEEIQDIKAKTAKIEELETKIGKFGAVSIGKNTSFVINKTGMYIFQNNTLRYFMNTTHEIVYNTTTGNFAELSVNYLNCPKLREEIIYNTSGGVSFRETYYCNGTSIWQGY